MAMNLAPERLHPETLSTLRQLVKLHGANRLVEAIREIAKAEISAPNLRRIRGD